MQEKRNLFTYTWPILVELILQFLVGNIDQIMVNQTSATAVSAIGNANQILSVLLITFSIISLAVTILATQLYGSDQRGRIAQVYSLGLVVNGVFGLAISLILLIFTDVILQIMAVPMECVNDTKIYLSIIALGLTVQSLYTTYVAIFRTKGWMKETMFISGGMNILNIIGNFILIPSLGVAGAALSSVIGRCVGFMVLVIFFRRHSDIQIDFKTLKPFPTKLLKKIMALGLPAGGESISYNVSQSVILRMVNTFGNAVIKTRTFANMFAMMSYLYGSAVSQAAQILVGFAAGAKDEKEVHRQVIRTCIFSVAIGCTVSTLLYLCSDILFGLLMDDLSMIALAKQIMFIEIFLEMGRAVNMTMVRSLQAVGDVKYPALIGVIFMWLVATLFSYILGVKMGMGLVGVWISMCLDECLRALIFLIRWYRGKWKLALE